MRSSASSIRSSLSLDSELPLLMREEVSYAKKKMCKNSLTPAASWRSLLHLGERPMFPALASTKQYGPSFSCLYVGSRVAVNLLLPSCGEVAPGAFGARLHHVGEQQRAAGLQPIQASE